VVHTTAAPNTKSPQPQSTSSGGNASGGLSKPPWATDEDFEAAEMAHSRAAAAARKRDADIAKKAASSRTGVAEHRRPWQDVVPAPSAAATAADSGEWATPVDEAALRGGRLGVAGEESAAGAPSGTWDDPGDAVSPASLPRHRGRLKPSSDAASSPVGAPSAASPSRRPPSAPRGHPAAAAALLSSNPSAPRSSSCARVSTTTRSRSVCRSVGRSASLAGGLPI